MRINQVFDSEGNLVESVETPFSEFELKYHKKAYRNQRVYEGITVGGVNVDTDDLTQQRIMATRILAKEDENYTVNWKTESGFVELNATQVIAVADAIRTHVQKCFDAEATISDTTFDSKEDIETAFDTAYES